MKRMDPEAVNRAAKQGPVACSASLDAWLFRTDPLERGVREEWYGTKVSERDWLPICIPSFWAENEDVGAYQGYGWYRTTFKAPAKRKRGRTKQPGACPVTKEFMCRNPRC